MTMDANTENTVWAVREAYLNLLELVDSVALAQGGEELEILRTEAQKTVLMLTASIILADGRYDADEEAFIRHFVNLSDKPGAELSYLNEYATMWKSASMEVPGFFQAAARCDAYSSTDIANSMLREIQLIGNNVSIAPKKPQTKGQKFVADYVAFLENFIEGWRPDQCGAADGSADVTEDNKVIQDAVSARPDLIHPKLPPQISRQYFDLLVSVSDEVSKICSNLESDKALLRAVENIIDTEKNNSEKFIRACVMFDLVQTYRILVGRRGESRSVEMSSMAFVVGHIVGSKDIIESVGYEKFIALHYDGALITAAESFLNNTVTENPITISLNKGSDAPVVKKSDFSLPAYLCYLGNPIFEKYAVTLRQFATVLAKVDGVISGGEETLLKEIYEMVHNPIPEISRNTVKVAKANGNQSMKEVLDELNSLVGLESVKQEVMTLINFANIQKEREKLGLKSPHVSYHLVLTGSPGTGKTTVARIVSKIYNKLGILEKGQLVETDRSGLIAEYLGQTSAKVNRAVDSALDGVLFIDEAYSLVDAIKEDYGREAVATLLKRMEDDRDRLVVMVAGYTEEMKCFINANSGLKSRFNKYIEFPDYIPNEMLEIFERQCRGLDYSLANEAKLKAFELFKIAYEQRDKSFGNGRYVRNIFEKTMELQANRVAGMSPLTKEILTTIAGDDIPE